MTSASPSRRAIVVGGSMSGLLAARVLSESHDEVVVLDRDDISEALAERRGVPQGRHVHGLLARGQQVLEDLFPGFTAEARAAGIPSGDLGLCRWYFHGERLARAETGLMALSTTRPLLERLVRGRVTSIRNVVVRERTKVVGLSVDDAGDRVLGVQVVGRDGGTASLEADLVVDASGRHSRTPAWLEELGYDRPREDRVQIDLTYTTARFRMLSQRTLGEDLAINPVSTPASPRGAFVCRVENGILAVSLTSVLGDRPAAGMAGFLEFARSMPMSDVYDVLTECEVVENPQSFRYPASVRRRYEELARFPGGLVVVGDAACSFNPVYGQGMTAAALEALALRDVLRDGEALRPQKFFAALAGIVETPWQMAATGDLAYPEVSGGRSFSVRVGNAYMSQVHAAATRDPAVTRGFMRVAGLVDPPSALMRPSMVWRVLRALVTRRLARAEALPPGGAPEGAVRPVERSRGASRVG